MIEFASNCLSEIDSSVTRKFTFCIIIIFNHELHHRWKVLDLAWSDSIFEKLIKAHRKWSLNLSWLVVWNNFIFNLLTQHFLFLLCYWWENVFPSERVWQSFKFLNSHKMRREVYQILTKSCVFYYVYLLVDLL